MGNCLWALVLDDDKSRHNSYRNCFNDHEKKIVADHCTRADQCISALDKRKYDLIFFFEEEKNRACLYKGLY